MRRSLAITLSAVLSCCSTSAPEVRLVAVPEHLSADSFPGATELLRGFDALASDVAWRGGDEVLYGLRLRRGAEARHWMLHLRVTEPLAIAREGDEVAAGELRPPLEWSIRINGEPREFRSRRCRVMATVTDEAGRVLGRSEPLLPRDLLDQGFSKACALVRQRFAEGRSRDGGAPDRAHRLAGAFYEGMDVGPLADATVCTIALLQVVQEDAVLAPLLWEVVEQPSFWSVVSNLGARIVLRPRFHAATEAPAPLDSDAGDVFSVPMSLVINDVPALHAELLVAASAPPFALCGGVLLITARHPNADVEFSCLLLGARRGPAAGAEAPVAPRSRQR